MSAEASNNLPSNDGQLILQHIEELTTHADQVQRRVLTEILSRNADVEYLKRHGLDGCTDRNTFKNMIPVVSYEDLKPYIDRIANGDASPILCSQPISEFLTSSGTSGGERKLIPTTEEEMKRKSFFNILLKHVINQFVQGLDKGKGMYFLFVKSESKTPGGLLARPALTSFFKHPNFINRPYDPYTDYTSPNQTILCSDSDQSMYSQLLCGLYFSKQVLRAGAIFASAFIRAIKFLETHWPLLTNDIRTGTINKLKITDPLVRESVMNILKPDPLLADFIESECRKESWEGIITRLWPNTKYIDVIVTGTMSQYIPTLDYYTNSLPIVSSVYASSECYFGINLNPLSNPNQVSYTLIPSMAYFEFLPLDRTTTTTHEFPNSNSSTCESQQLVDLVDVQLGKEYELVVTTYAGLYRYRVGDILRVSGFKNNAPQFNFVCRKNVILSIDTDKVDEVELQNAVREASKNLIPYGGRVLEYTSYPDIHTNPGHYVIYWEISLKETINIPPSVFENCCLTLEESLNFVYRRGRVLDKSIGPLEIKIVENGTFDKLMDYAINHGASINQYKTPRCVTHAPILQLLNSNIVSNHFNPKCPKWVLEWSTEN